ncbi:MAG TPA: aminotransferase class III-fold pyridoxal phosphate-dependent enzyme, partial [Xanthomonadaceae bacterium]|nr:aminotransferase class III-fold pyridoxal phosphate-dependent enzyme [Xanthomonadaceae bacterium]
LASPEIAANVARQSAALREGLAALDAELRLFSQVRGRGLMLGAELNPRYAGRAGEVLDHAAAAGLLLLQAGPDVLRFVPPLSIADVDIVEGLARLRTALRAFVAA